MFNHIVIVGRLGFEPSFKTTKTGSSMCKLSVAVNIGWGQNRKTDWYDVFVFGKLADTCKNKLSKGDVVCASGTLSLRTYDAKDGTKRISPELTADDVKFLQIKDSQTGQKAQQPEPIETISYEESNPNDENPFAVDNNIPF